MRWTERDETMLLSVPRAACNLTFAQTGYYILAHEDMIVKTSSGVEMAFRFCQPPALGLLDQVTTASPFSAAICFREWLEALNTMAISKYVFERANFDEAFPN